MGWECQLLDGWHLLAHQQKLLGAIGWQLLDFQRLPLKAGRQVAHMGGPMVASGVV